MAQFEFVQWLVKWIFAQQDYEFEWDHGNHKKNKTKHDVSQEEAEEVFFNARVSCSARNSSYSKC